MEAIHGWCRAAGVPALALNASEFGRPLYEAMGNRVTPSPMMFIGLESETSEVALRPLAP